MPMDATKSEITMNGEIDGAETKPQRFVTPAYKQLALSHGDWIRVKERLTYGESVRLQGAGAVDLLVNSGVDEAGQHIGIDLAAFEMARITAWVVEWSFADERGKRVPVNRDTIESLDPDTAEEIKAAIDRHVEKLEAEKNDPSIGSTSAPT